MHISKRGQVDPFYVMEAFSDAQKLAKTGIDVAHLSLGQPSATPPQSIMQHAAEQAKNNPLGYTETPGLPPLREAIAEHYQAQYGVKVSPERVYVTVGSSGAYFMSLLAAFDVGDKVAIVAPHYPASPNMMRALGIEPLILASTMDDHYQPTLAMLEALEEKPKGLVIASPSNPTGTMIAPDVMKDIIAYCEAHNIRLISDEIYHGVTYGERKAVSALEHSQRMIVTNSFSKYYLLPGWRLGWAVMPEDLCRSVESLLQNFYISPPSLSQYVALEAMKERAAFDGVVATYKDNRDQLIAALSEAGISRVAPAEGAFYLYADVSHLTNDSKEFCNRMLHEAHVCAIPGVDFDKAEGHRFVRFSYSVSDQTIAKSGERLISWLSK